MAAKMFYAWGVGGTNIQAEATAAGSEGEMNGESWDDAAGRICRGEGGGLDASSDNLYFFAVMEVV